MGGGAWDLDSPVISNRAKATPEASESGASHWGLAPCSKSILAACRLFECLELVASLWYPNTYFSTEWTL